MQVTSKIFPLIGQVQHYTWGGTEFIPHLLGHVNPDGRPFAEYWMGAHEKAPAIIPPEAEASVALDRFIAQHPQELLGQRVYDKFGRLPYLFKVLDVKDMLSIQVHPAKRDAERDFAEESKRLGAEVNGERNYKDDNHKPEIMLALGPFWLLHGFRPVADLKAVLEKVPELQFLADFFDDGDYEKLYRTVMEMPQEEVNRRLMPLAERIVPLYRAGRLTRSQADFWAARACLSFCSDDRIDRGIFSIYLFNLVELREGQAIFQDAGIPHAYLEGHNMELMANSDNVLRGGLTTKRVDVPELMKHVRFEPVIPEIIEGMELPDTGEMVYPTPAADFELRSLELAGGESTLIPVLSADIFLVYSGEARFSDSGTVLDRQKGEALIAFSGAQLQVKAISDCRIFHATVPYPQAEEK